METRFTFGLQGSDVGTSAEKRVFISVWPLLLLFFLHGGLHEYCTRGFSASDEKVIGLFYQLLV